MPLEALTMVSQKRKPHIHIHRGYKVNTGSILLIISNPLKQKQNSRAIESSQWIQ